MVPQGEGVFETLRVVDSQPHAVTRHLQRLQQGARTLGLPQPESVQIRQSIVAHLSEQPLAFGRMRVTWAAGSEGALLSIESAPTPLPLEAASLTVDRWRVPARGPLVGIKSTNRRRYAAAADAAQRRGFAEALLANTAGQVCETTTANVFFVLDGTLCTPAISTGCLPGIARGLIMDLCEVAEVEIPLDALAGASEVFLTSSLRGVQPVLRIDDREYPAPGALTVDAQDAWLRLADQNWDPPPSSTEYENDERVR